MDRGEPLGVIQGELLCEAVDIHPGERVLDVVAGNGAASLAAARRGADVIAVDSAERSLESAARLAAAYGLPLSTRIADAQDLPFDEDTFDAVLSTFGAMLVPDQQRVADELVRVCRPGGRIGVVSWPPASLIGDVSRATDRYLPPPLGARSPIDWGAEDRLRELFGNRISSLRLATRSFTFRYRSAAQMLDWLRRCFRPTQVVFESLDGDGQGRFLADLAEISTAYNRADDGTFVAPTDYVEVVAVVR
jgi:SAM-dependent methyltransferase